MNNCLGCAGAPPDGGVVSFIMGIVNGPLGIPFIILFVLFFLFLIHQLWRLGENRFVAQPMRSEISESEKQRFLSRYDLAVKVNEHLADIIKSLDGDNVTETTKEIIFKSAGHIQSLIQEICEKD